MVTSLSLINLLSYVDVIVRHWFFLVCQVSAVVFWTCPETSQDRQDAVAVGVRNRRAAQGVQRQGPRTLRPLSFLRQE